MNLIYLVAYLVVIGIILWAVNTYIPMDTNIKKIINVVVIILVVLWLLTSLVGPLPMVTIGR